MKLFNDKKIIGLVIILVVFTIGYFIIVNKISYAFSDNYDVNNSYKKTIEIIEKSAKKYGEDNLGLFKEDNIIYIKVQDLIDNNYLIGNEEGKINNPLNEKGNLNSNIIKIKHSNEEITVEVDS